MTPDAFTLTVNVTEEIIQAGRWADCTLCPMALAEQAALQGQSYDLLPNVKYHTSYLFDPESKRVLYHALHSSPVEQFIADFDGKREVEPFQSTLFFTRWYQGEDS